MSKLSGKNELNLLIGKLKIMAAAVQPGMVITEDICDACFGTLMEAADKLKKMKIDEGVTTP
ncbi:TPA: hypothetical protein ACGU7D_004281 [Vibrio vulnificus]